MSKWSPWPKSRSRTSLPGARRSLACLPIALTTRRSHANRACAALEYAEELHAGHFEKLLLGLQKKAVRAPAPPVRPVLETLSPEKRKLVALRLRKQSLPAAWFPNAGTPDLPRLFCFPHAGGGARQPVSLAGWAAVPVRLPGRESRLAEAPFERMGPLVAALADNIDSYLDRPFAFFGHSMGAAIAFELAARTAPPLASFARVY